MQTEIEAKFLNINHDEVRAKLKILGAKLEQPSTVYKRYNLDFSDKSLEKKGGWVRVRSNGTFVTLTYKQLDEWTVDGVKEAEVEVSDFDETIKILEAVGLKARSFQITKREIWKYKDTEIVLDEWPWVKQFIEIEGP